MKNSQFILLSLLASSAIASGQSAATLVESAPEASGSHQFIQSGRQLDLDLCIHEICRMDETGRLLVEPVAAGSAAAVVRQASDPDEERYLVFYPTGKMGDEDSRRILRNKYVVTLKEGADLEAVKNRCGIGSIELAYPGGNIAICEEESAGRVLSQLSNVLADPAIMEVEPLLARKRFKKRVPTDPFYAPGGRIGEETAPEAYQWYLNNTGANGGLVGIDLNYETALDLATGEGVTVAVVDDGLATDHEDLLTNTGGAHLNLNGGELDDPTSFNIDDTHGTAVAGIIAAAIDNEDPDPMIMETIGITGVAPDATLSGIRLIAGPVDDSQEAQAFLFDNNAISVYNNSWGPSDSTLALELPGSLALAALEDGATNGRGGLGSIFVWAAGNGGEINDNSNYDGYANSPYTIAVGAVSDTGRQAGFSENGANLVVCGLSDGGGQGILTTSFSVEQDNDDMDFRVSEYIADFGGTSASAPMVSGVIAMMLEVNPALTERDVQDILIRNSTLIDPQDGDWVTNAANLSFNHKYGAGLVNARSAVLAASNRAVDNEDEFNRPLGAKAPLQRKTIFFNPETTDPNEPTGIIPDDGGTGYLAEFDMTQDSQGNEFENLRVEHVQLVASIITERRSDLEIVLISPNGTQSILQEVDEANDEQSIVNFAFMTVRNWGEGSAGTWVVQATDRITGNAALFNSATLIIHGTPDPGAVVSQAPLLASNRLITVNQGAEFSYRIDAVGANSITVGDLPEGITYDPDTLIISGASPEPGVFQIPLSLVGDGGIATPTIALVVSPTALALGDALGLPDFPAVTDGDRPWDFEFVDTNDPGVPDDQKVAARSADSLGDNRQSIFGFDNIGRRVIIFDWKTSSEEGADRLYFNQGGDVPQFWDAFISGDREWATMAVELPAESNSVRWIYSKDAFDLTKVPANSVGEDRGLVDNIRLVDQEKFRADVIEAANITGFDFTVDSRAQWLPLDFPGGTPSETSNIRRLLRSSAIGNGQTVSMSGWVEGPGTFSCTGFNYAQAGDVFEFLVDGVVRTSVNGESGSPLIAVSDRINEGRHYIELRYRKDFRGSGGLSFSALGIFDFDSVLLDNISYVADGSAAALLEGLESGIYGDEDGDGYSNQLEVAFGGLVNTPDIPRYLPKLVTTDSGDQVIEYGLNPSLIGITLEAQESTDLTEDNWIPTTRAEMVRTEGEVEIYQIPIISTPGAPKTFFRVLSRME